MTGPEITFTVPIELVSEANRRDHHFARARRVKVQRTAVYFGAMAAGLLERGRLRDVVPPCVVTMTRIAPRDLDSDNLVSGCKHVRDEVAELLGLPNDRDPRVRWRCTQERGAHAVRVTIRPCPDHLGHPLCSWGPGCDAEGCRCGNSSGDRDGLDQPRPGTVEGRRG